MTLFPFHSMPARATLEQDPLLLERIPTASTPLVLILSGCFQQTNWHSPTRSRWRPLSSSESSRCPSVFSWKPLTLFTSEDTLTLSLSSYHRLFFYGLYSDGWTSSSLLSGWPHGRFLANRPVADMTPPKLPVLLPLWLLCSWKEVPLNLLQHGLLAQTLLVASLRLLLL